MYCMYCGTTIGQDAQFCETCGKRQNIAVSASTTASTPSAVPTKSNKAVVWLLVLFLGPLLFVMFHVVPAIIFAGLVFFWLFVLPHAGITRKNALIGTGVAV